MFAGSQFCKFFGYCNSKDDKDCKCNYISNEYIIDKTLSSENIKFNNIDHSYTINLDTNVQGINGIDLMRSAIPMYENQINNLSNNAFSLPPFQSPSYKYYSDTTSLVTELSTNMINNYTFSVDTNNIVTITNTVSAFTPNNNSPSAQYLFEVLGIHSDQLNKEYAANEELTGVRPINIYPTSNIYLTITPFDRHMSDTTYSNISHLNKMTFTIPVTDVGQVSTYEPFQSQIKMFNKTVNDISSLNFRFTDSLGRHMLRQDQNYPDWTVAIRVISKI